MVNLSPEALVAAEAGSVRICPAFAMLVTTDTRAVAPHVELGMPMEHLDVPDDLVMVPTSTAALQDAIRNLHGCGSRFVESVPVTESHEGQTVWTGEVQVFDLIDHPTATRAYAWAHAMDESDNRRFVVVLHDGPVDSPEKAVKVAIIAEHKGIGNK